MRFHNQDYAIVGLLKACAQNNDLQHGTRLHDHILQRGLLDGNSPFLASSLISMYAKCGDLAKARSVHDKLLMKNVASWNALIGGYSQQGLDPEAFICFEQMQNECLFPDAITFICIIKACASVRMANKGGQLHVAILNRNLSEKNVLLGTALVDMYAKCGMLAMAERVLEELSIRNEVSWSAIIAGYARQGSGHKALNCFELMQNEGLCPDVVTFTCALNACGHVRAIEKGKQIHDTILRMGFLEKDIILGNAVVDMYAKCGMLLNAQAVHDGLHLRDVISWSALISGYAQLGQGQEALSCFRRMRNESLSPDGVTYVCILNSCTVARNINMGMQIHNEILSNGLFKKNLLLGTAVLDMYAKCGLLESARQVFEELPVRNEVSWSTLITGYTQHGQVYEAFNCLQQMQTEGLSPDAVTFTCILTACGIAGAVATGQQIHDEIRSRGLLEKSVVLGNALVDMYRKCGILDKAQKVHDELQIQNTVSWSTLIAGYAQQGQGYNALHCFKQMQENGFAPDAVTLLSVLNACCHSGLLDIASVTYENMSKIYNMTPSLEHHTCIAIHLAYLGYFGKALSLIRTMPTSDYTLFWLAFMGACKKWVNVEHGKFAFNQILQRENSCTAAYSLMISIYVAAGFQEDAEKVEAMRLKVNFCNRSYQSGTNLDKRPSFSI